MAKRIGILCLLLAMSTSYAADDSFLGSWKFYKMLYRGQLLDPINPNFHMYFNFLDGQTNSILYYRDDEVGFCEREAVYQYDPSHRILYQQVTWLNPDNADFCKKDPDMEFGKESWSGFELRNGDLALEVPLSDESLILLWRPTSRLKAKTQCSAIAPSPGHDM